MLARIFYDGQFPYVETEPLDDWYSWAYGDPQEETPPRVLELDEVILNTSDWIRLSIVWEDGRVTVFERDRGSSVWTMLSRDGSYRMVDPAFSYDALAFTILFPTSSSYYYLFPDNSGSFGSELLTWSFETDPSFSRYSESGYGQTRDMMGTLSRHTLVTISIRWRNGETTNFYRHGDSTWLVNHRNNSNTRETPSFVGTSSHFSIGLSSSTLFNFYNDGTGVYGNESFNWSYSFSSN
jgi:hypothetical protein